jgi:hypothetical protein
MNKTKKNKRTETIERDIETLVDKQLKELG